MQRRFAKPLGAVTAGYKCCWWGQLGTRQERLGPQKGEGGYLSPLLMHP